MRESARYYKQLHNIQTTFSDLRTMEIIVWWMAGFIYLFVLKMLLCILWKFHPHKNVFCSFAAPAPHSHCLKTLSTFPLPLSCPPVSRLGHHWVQFTLAIGMSAGLMQVTVTALSSRMRWPCRQHRRNDLEGQIQKADFFCLGQQYLNLNTK